MNYLLTFQNKLNNFTSVCNIISKPFYVVIAKRYYPKLALPELSASNALRILRVFTKDKALPTPATNYVPMLQAFYKTHSEREEFFKSLRKTALSREFVFKPTDHMPLIQELKDLSFLMYYLRESYSTQGIHEINRVAKPSAKDYLSQSQTPQKLSLEEKTNIFMEMHDEIIKKMEFYQDIYEKQHIIDWEMIKVWEDYIKNRGSIIDCYTEKEHNIDNFLQKVLKENTLPRDIIMSKLKDKYENLKKQSNLPNELFNTLQEKCFLEEDYKNKIAAMKEAINLLENHTSLNNNALILLAICSNAVVLDENFMPKLTREVYTLFNQFPERFDIKYTDFKPDTTDIFNALKQKNYLIKQSSDQIPKGHLVSTAPLLHKTLIIFTNNGTYCTAMFTSAKKGTELLSPTQECNFDPETRNKEQRFLVFPHFILCPDDTITVDLLAVGYAQDKDVHAKIIRFFEEKQNEWENNNVQEPMIVNAEVFRNIAKMFYKEHFENLENDYQNFLKKLKAMTPKDKQEYLKGLSELKNNAIEELNKQKYLSKLPENFQKLFALLQYFEKQNESQQQFAAKREKNKQMEIEYQNREAKRKQEEENRKATGNLTLTEKRIAKQKQIAENKKATLAIEDAPSENKADNK